MLSYITVYTFYMLTSIDTIKIVLDKVFFFYLILTVSKNILNFGQTLME